MPWGNWSDHMFYVRRPDLLYQQLRFRQQRSSIEQGILQGILAEYGLQVQGKVQAQVGRSEDLVFETPHGKKMLKRYKDTLIPAALIHEHSILNYLAQIDFPAPRLTPMMNGDTLLQKDGRCYALFDFLEGYFQYHHYFFLPNQMRQFIMASGQVLGGLHNALKDFSPEGYHPNGFKSRTEGRWREIGWFLEKLERCRQELPHLQTGDGRVWSHMFSEHAGRVEETLQNLDDRLKAAGPLRLIIHGDYGPYNLFFKRGAPTVILDFELAHLDWRLADLAMALPAFANSRLGSSLQKMKSFLEGYRSACPIDDEELRLLPLVWQFFALRRVVFCWYRYCDTPTRRWLNESQHKLKLFDWIANHHDTLSTLLT
jgi:Ser/Thr protein kinase RdoA (MazF antagonist)